MAQLSNLQGVAKQLVDCNIVRSASAAIISVRGGIAATMAGDNGAVNVWKDDAGKWHVAFYRNLREIDHQVLSASMVRWWLKKWMPKMHH